MSQILVTGEAKIRDIQGPVVANSGVITALNGAANQYVRGDGTLASFPTSGGGGSSVSYYLNGSVNQGTFGGSTYYQMSKNAIVGTGTNFSASANGLIAQFITDDNDPDVVSIPSGNWNVEFFMNVSASSGALASFYVEFYKYNGSTFTLLATNVATPEQLTNTTTVDAYYTSVAMPLSSMAVTDRLAIRIFVNVAGKTVTLYTEDNRLCQVVTTFSKGLASLNNLTDQSQYLTTGTSGTNFAIVSTGDTHTFNLPVASATNTGKLSSTDWSTFNNKLSTATAAATYVPYTGATTNVDLGNNDFTALGISGIAIEAKLNGTGSSPLILRTGTSGYSYGNDSISLISSPTTANTLIITSDVSSVTKIAQFGLGSLTATRTFTLPDLSGTLALLEGTQTFSGAKTFSLDILVNGLTIGRGAGSISTNTVVGSSALSANTTGYGNTSIGLNNLIANTTGFFNVAIGASSLISNTTGTYNAALGTSSLYNNTTGSNNTAVGQQAGESNTTGSNNTYIGRGSGFNITTGSNNTIIGAYTGTAALANNIVLADGAGNVRYQWNGTNNVFGNPISGTSASFSSNVNVGTNIAQLLPITTTNFQILTGCYYDGSNIIATATSGTRIISNAGSFTFNNFTGATIGGSVTDTTRLTIASTGAATFSGQVAINGASLDINPSSGNSNITLRTANVFEGYIQAITGGGILFGTGASATERMRITSGGNVGIGTSSPSSVLEVAGTSSTGDFRISRTVSPSTYFYIKAPGGSPSASQLGVNGTDVMTLNASGNVGIGTSSPNRQLEVMSTDGGILRLSRNDGSVTTDESIGTLEFYTNDGDGPHVAAYVRGLGADLSGQNFGRFGALSFGVSKTANQDAVEAMRIDLSGNVGIGTSTPAVTLHALGKIRSQDSRGGSFAAVEIYGGDSSFNPYISVDQNNPLTFITGGSERMRITGDGKVLINGTSSTDARLISYGDSSNYAAYFNQPSIYAGGYRIMRWFANGNVVMDISSSNGTDLSFNNNQVGFVSFGTSGIERMRITSGGSVCINATSPGSLSPYLYNFNGDGSRINAAFEVSIATPGFTSIQFRNPNGAVGSIAINTSSVSYNTTSDYRLKEDLKEFNGLEKVSAIKVYDYKWKSCNERMDGVLAHELAEVLPYAVNGEKDGEQMQGVDYSKIVPILIKSIQELQAKIVTLESKIN